MAKIPENDEDLGQVKSANGTTKSGWLIGILLGVNILLIVAIGGYLVLFGGMDKNKSDDEVEVKKGGNKGEPSEIGPIVELEPFLVNLDEPGSSRYLKAVVQIEMADKISSENVKERSVQLRDLIITYLSSLNYSQTQGMVNKEIIRTSLITKISAKLGKAKVRNLYFTEFVIQ